jgi:hypothetical protein
MAKSKVDSNSNKPASKAGGKSRRNKKLEQQVQPSEEQPDEEDTNQEELAYQQAHQRDQAESSEEEHEESEDYFEDADASSAEEDEQPLSKSRRRRTTLADEEAGFSQADEDKQSPSANKTRRQTKDLADKEIARLSQAEQLQGQTNPNPDLSLPPNPTLVGASIQNVSSANAYQSDTTRNSGDITLNLDLVRQGAVTDDGIASNTMISRLKRLNHVKSVALNDQKISRGLEIIRSQETISLHDPDFIAFGFEARALSKDSVQRKT